ncbi:cytochrome C oxidase subunit IV family protein [Bradyrhizobium oligotrophicum S58]
MVLDRLTLAWLQLLSLAIATLAASLLLPNRWLADALVLALALAKGRVIVLDFSACAMRPRCGAACSTAWLLGLVALAGLAVALRALV